MATIPAEGSNWCVECVACCERPVDSVFYSCGHMTFCKSSLPSIYFQLFLLKQSLDLSEVYNSLLYIISFPGFQCAMEYWKMKETSYCPICRAIITDVIRTYKSWWRLLPWTCPETLESFITLVLIGCVVQLLYIPIRIILSCIYTYTQCTTLKYFPLFYAFDFY